MLAEVDTTAGGRKVGSGARGVGLALIMSSLGACGHPRAEGSIAWGCWRCGCTKRARSLDGGTLGTLAFKGWAEEKQPPKDPRQEQATREKEADGLVLEAAGVLGLSHLSVSNRVGLLYTQILETHPGSLSW